MLAQSPLVEENYCFVLRITVFQSVHVLEHIFTGGYSGQKIQRIYHLLDFIYHFIQCLVESFLGMVVAISDHCLLLEFVLKMRLQGMDNYLEEEKKIHS